MDLEMYCGYVAIVGRPNVGKSTLLNRLIGKKISITSHKPQTTRHRILGVKTVGNLQTVYVDTPGFHQGGERLINRWMNKTVSSVVQDVDVILFVVDAHHWFDEDSSVLDLLEKSVNGKPIILVINKVDHFHDKSEVLPVIDGLQKKFNFSNIVPISALKDHNIAELEKVIAGYLPKDHHGFPDDYITDRTPSFLLSEVIREKIFRTFQQEVPYTTTVIINSIEKKKNIFHVDSTIYVEREGQKKIIIPELKKIGMESRRDMEVILAGKVFLRQWVKVKADWPDQPTFLNQLGYES